MSAPVEEWELGPDHEGARLDIVLSTLLDDVSRSRIQKWIGEGLVTVNDGPARTSHRCRHGDRLRVRIPEPVPAEPQPERIPLNVLFEDSEVLVLNKQSGMVVHPGPGHPNETLVNALLHYCHDFSGIGDVRRPGIVHRLDRGTSGVMVVAKSERAHRSLSSQFQHREVEKYYLALVYGRFPDSLKIDAPLGRDRKDRKKISTRSDKTRPALSEARRLETLPMSSLVEVRIFTGRTHQIRVHLSEAGYPIVGDEDYPGSRPRPRSTEQRQILATLDGMSRPALHAKTLWFDHPSGGERLRFEAPLPDDISTLIDSLRGRT